MFNVSMRRDARDHAAPLQADGICGARDSLLGLVMAIALMGVVGLASTPLAWVFDSNEPAFLALKHVGTLVFQAGLLLIAVMFISHDGLLRILRARTWGPSIVFLSAVASYAVLLAYNGVVEALSAEYLRPAAQVQDGFFESAWLLAFLGFTVVVTAPLVEEVFFRGFLFAGLGNSFGVWPAALTSGLVFSLAHVNLGAIIPFTLIGAILALAYHRTGSLLTPISIHFVFNAFSFSILVLVPGSR